MQKSRRWRGLELDLLPVALLVACAGQPAPPAMTASAAPNASAAPAALAPGPDATPAPDPAPTRSPIPIPVPGPNPSPTSPAAANPDPSALPPLPKGTLVLQVGDSFAAALGVELGKRLKAAGVRSALEYKTASYIPNWSFGGDIPDYIAKYRPDLVLITLGANEVEIKNPEQRAGAIRHLVGELGGRPCVWIAPPLWKVDNGLMKVIRDNVAPCRYFDSNALVRDLPRGRDKIHPSAEGREIWAGIVFQWLVSERVGTDAKPWALKAEAPATK